MGVKERREREKSQLRRRILDAALEIINKEGFAALSMRKLADRIEYSAASIYLYFESRDQLAQELAEAGFQDLLALLSAASGVPDAAAALQATALAYVKYGLTNPAMYRLIFMSDSDFMKAAFGKQSEESAGSRAYALLVELAARLQNEGVMHEATKSELAELIWTTLHGIVSLQITCVEIHLTAPERLVSLMVASLTGSPTKPARLPRPRR